MPATKNPRLAATLVGIPAPELSPQREKVTAVGRAVYSSAEPKPRVEVGPPAKVEIDGAITTTAKIPNLGERPALTEARPTSIPEPVERTFDQTSDEPSLDSSDEGDDEYPPSSVVGRVLIGAALGATLAILLVAVVRMGRRADSAQDLEPQVQTHPTATGPRWKPVTPFPPTAPAPAPPAMEDPAVPGAPAATSEERWSRKAAGPGVLSVPLVAPPPDAPTPAAVDGYEGEGAPEALKLGASGAPKSVGSPASEQTQGAVRFRRPPPRSSWGVQAVKDAPVAPPAAANSESPSLRPQPTIPPPEKVKSKTGSGTDPDSTMVPSLE